MDSLEKTFDKAINKAKLEVDEYNKPKIERWNKDLEKINEIYSKLSFLTTKGIKVEKVCCTQFNKKDADGGFYPYLRLPQFLATFHPIHNDPNFDFGGGANGELTGKFNCESFLIKLAKITVKK